MIAIIDYKAGNLTSVKLAFDALNVSTEITSKPEEILSAERVVFPGVGAAGSAMNTLQQLQLVDVIQEVAGRGTPFLGICLGMQIILEQSEEDNGVICLGLIPGTTKLFEPLNKADKVPQMGWNSVEIQDNHPVFENIENNSEFYFVHSYYPAPQEDGCVLGRTDYAGVKFASVIGKDNILATQFHPEKSGKVGLKLLENFCNW
ncbi:imidazole glycerol phosphate synthase subunit HisH [Verrucomicrobiota bacterium]